MEIPQSSEAVNKVGHIEHGRTIAIHSLAVLPEFQKRGIGSMLMKAYVQRMASSNNADRISLLAYDHLVPFYESLGFEKKGKGGSKHGGVEWVDMVSQPVFCSVFTVLLTCLVNRVFRYSRRVW